MEATMGTNRGNEVEEKGRIPQVAAKSTPDVLKGNPDKHAGHGAYEARALKYRPIWYEMVVDYVFTYPP